MGSKFYVVRKGREVGIFSTWDECREQVDGFKKSEYRSFDELKDAENYLENGFISPDSVLKVSTNPIEAKVYVDGSWNESKQQYGYGFVLVKNGKSFSSGYDKGDNPQYIDQKQVSGEVVAVLKGLNRAIYLDLKHVEIVYDFEGIEKWTTGEWSAKAAIAKAYVHQLKRLNQNIDISFKKVKSHSRDQFNDMADKLASKGANK